MCCKIERFHAALTSQYASDGIDVSEGFSVISAPYLWVRWSRKSRLNFALTYLTYAITEVGRPLKFMERVTGIPIPDINTDAVNRHMYKYPE